MAGTLKRLGLHLPQPEKPADEANPRGFYETQWVVDFHKSLLNPIPVRTGDSRPGAAELAARAARQPEAAQRLRAWLSEHLTEPQLIIKDPRAFWVEEVWRKVAEELDVELLFLTMLRYPMEVAKSRDSAFLADRSADFRRLRETSNVAAWCNVAFESERATRGDRRCYLRYTDLVADWRAAMRHVADQLGLEFAVDLTTGDHHPIDEFVDPGLNHSQFAAGELDVPVELRSHAERVWETMNVLVDSPKDESAIDQLTVLRDEYVRMHEHAVAIALDDITAQDVETRNRVRKRLGRRHRRQVRQLRSQLRAARAGGTRQTAVPAGPGSLRRRARTLWRGRHRRAADAG